MQVRVWNAVDRSGGLVPKGRPDEVPGGTILVPTGAADPGRGVDLDEGHRFFDRFLTRPGDPLVALQSVHYADALGRVKVEVVGHPPVGLGPDGQTFARDRVLVVAQGGELLPGHRTREPEPRRAPAAPRSGLRAGFLRGVKVILDSRVGGGSCDHPKHERADSGNDKETPI